MVLDVNSGSVHVVDDCVYDVLSCMNEGKNAEEAAEAEEEEKRRKKEEKRKRKEAEEAAAAEDGCWKFKHGSGGADTPNAYAKFVYDLSQFNGNNVVIAIGVFNGEKSSDENKLVFHSVEFN